MANKEYIERLKMAVEHLHGCTATHVDSVPVHEVFNGQTVWKGIVEVFDISGHPKAKRAYGWSHVSGTNDADERFVAVLEIPPVHSALSALRVSLVREIRRKTNER